MISETVTISSSTRDALTGLHGKNIWTTADDTKLRNVITISRERMYHQLLGDQGTTSESWKLIQYSTFYLFTLFFLLKRMWWRCKVIKGQVSVLQLTMNTSKKYSIIGKPEIREVWQKHEMLRPRSLFIFSCCTRKTLAISTGTPFWVPLLNTQGKVNREEKRKTRPKNTEAKHKQLSDFRSMVNKERTKISFFAASFLGFAGLS